MNNINDGEGVPFSANLDITLKKVKVEKTKVFTSATKPLLLPCEVEEFGQKKNITLMFKTGDDMRQDAFVVQLFAVMDRVLKNVGLDLKFSIYNVISCTKDDGVLQFVPDSVTITKVR